MPQHNKISTKQWKQAATQQKQASTQQNDNSEISTTQRKQATTQKLAQHIGIKPQHYEIIKT